MAAVEKFQVDPTAYTSGAEEERGEKIPLSSCVNQPFICFFYLKSIIIILHYSH